MTTQLPLFDPVEVPLTKGYVALQDPCDAEPPRNCTANLREQNEC